MERDELIEHVGSTHFGLPDFPIPTEANFDQWERIHQTLHEARCDHVHHEAITDEHDEILRGLIWAVAQNEIALVSVVLDGRSMAAVAHIEHDDEEYRIRPLALLIDDATYDRVIPPPDDV